MDNRKQVFVLSNKLRAGTINQQSERVIKAAFTILQSGFFKYMESHDHSIWVELDGSLACSCKDFQYRYSHKRNFKGECKHIMAAKLKIEAAALGAGIKTVSYKDGFVGYNYYYTDWQGNDCTTFFAVPFTEALAKADTKFLAKEVANVQSFMMDFVYD